MSERATRDYQLNNAQEVQQALDDLKLGVVDESSIMDQFGDVPGIERSIAVAKAERTNVRTREDVADIVTEGVEL